MLPWFCAITYSRSMIFAMCSAIVASVPARTRERVSLFFSFGRTIQGEERTNTVLVHKRDEVGLGQETWRRCLTLFELTHVRHKRLSDVKVRDGRRCPAIVRVDVEVVSGEHDEACVPAQRRRNPTSALDLFVKFGQNAPEVENVSPAMSITTVVVRPSASDAQLARNRRTTNSYTRFSSPVAVPVQAVGWMGGWALSFFLPLRGALNSPS